MQKGENKADKTIMIFLIHSSVSQSLQVTVSSLTS